ncbi:uncharacterized protein LOC142996338 [Genypterus blacodes]|uniref:uncharacterized protein LOC142996338 n=1 Tax=Genypterus blacodes TaxID=154954 RepID=UPI003F76D911
MHSVDGSGSPRKRTISRGMSEEESLRSIIKETEGSSRRLTRSDSKGGILKKRSDSQQSDQDLYMGLPDMLELQASYDEVVQELRGLEVEREVVLFQVDVLQDTLEGVEELLAETQREAKEANMELEREREAKRKLESLVCSLMREVERLKEESSSRPFDPESRLPARQDEGTRQALMPPPCTTETASSQSGSRGLTQPDQRGQSAGEEDEGSPLKKLQRMVGNVASSLPSLALDNPLAEDGVLRRPYDAHDGRDPSPDQSNDSDSVSAYEDAVADTPEMDRLFPGVTDTTELPDDSSTGKEDGSLTNNCQHSDTEAPDNTNADTCILS